MSGALGLGGGAIFNPLLLSMGVPPSVSSGTGMYMILFSTLSSSITYIIYHMLSVDYGLWIGLWCVLSSIIGLFVLNKIVKKFDRQSPIVIVLTVVMALSAILVPIFGALDTIEEYNAGIDILKFNSIC